MDAVTKVVAFLVVLGVLVVFHELGHYWVARWCKVKVLRFSVGFGRIVWSRRFGPDRTEWAVSAIPLGGYVKMVDEREGAVPRAIFRAPSIGRASGNASPSWRPARSRTCCSRCCCLPAPTSPAFRRSARLLAAPPAGSPAAMAGIRDGDLVVAADGAPVRSWQDLRWRLLRASGSADVAIDVERPDGGHLRRMVSLASLSGADWEGNFMPQLGFRSDLGPPLIDEALPDKPAARAGHSRRRPHPRDRRRGDSLAGRSGREDERAAGRGGDVSHQPATASSGT